MTADLIEVRGLEVGFATDRGMARVLDRVNLSIRRGEIMGLVGESGCGKTTLARAILGILPANAARIGGGEILFDGGDLLRRPEAELERQVRGRQITYIPQDPYTAFNPVFTVGAQIMELLKWKSPRRDAAEEAGGGRRPALLRRYPRARRQSDREAAIDLLRLVQIPNPADVLRRYPHELSGGQRQRIMIAMALLPAPKLLIADEPTTALDVTVQAQILKLLRNLAREHGVSVLITTHDLGVAYEICDRITVMYAGQEAEAAPVAAFFRRPSHPYTRKLLDSLPSAEGGIQGIRGDIPSLVAPPPGCRFNPRCDFADAACPANRPGVTAIDEDHSVRCHHPLGGAGAEPAATAAERAP